MSNNLSFNLVPGVRDVALFGDLSTAQFQKWNPVMECIKIHERDCIQIVCDFQWCPNHGTILPQFAQTELREECHSKEVLKI